MDLAALERALSATEPRPLLVDARLVRRVIKRHGRLPGFGLQVPHARSYAIERAALLDIVSPAELGRSAAELPDRVILLPRPDPDELARTPAPEMLEQMWRATFHARVHLEVEATAGRSEARMRERIHRIGQTEFDEIRLVLRQDELLLPPHDDRGTYAELCALYLELRHFAPALLRETFPALDDHGGIDAVIAEEIDAPRLLAACRPAGAPPSPRRAAHAEGAGPRGEATVPPPTEAPPATLRGEAENARRRGNVVRSAIAHLRLAAADGPDAEASRAEAHADLQALAVRLDAALRGPDGAGGVDVGAWAAQLSVLARRAASRSGLFRWVEARVLYDLQRACLASERAIGKVDLVDWAASLGRRSLARLLPATRPIRVAQQLASAAKKLGRLGIADADRARLGVLLAEARRRADENIRAALRPAVLDAFREVGLRPEDVPERVALQKVVEDLLDQATAHGHLGLGVLRDALSRSQLKLGDLAGPGQLFGGDPLLLADHRLSIALDGVHRRGEIYLRGLQKLSSLLFGTAAGRFLTLYGILPFGGAYILLEGTGFLLTELGHLSHLLEHHHHIHLVSWASFAVVSALLFGLLHSKGVRAAARTALRAVGFAFAAVFVHAPRWILARPAVRLVLESRAVVVLGRYVLKPGLVAAALVEASPVRRDARPTEIAAAAAVFVTANLALNSRTGALVEEITLDAVAGGFRRLRRQVLPGLYRLIRDVFHRITGAIERGLYAVDEWLRFHEGQSRSMLAVKAALGVVWFAIAYVVRVYVNLIVEPTINPIKHFPVVTVAAKLLLPITKGMYDATKAFLTGKIGPLLAGPLTTITVPFLSGFFGFLAWEFKENYKLYRATRPETLRPVPIGHHGETMATLLKPGLHSGTVPKLWAKLRRAVRKGDASVEKHEEAMRELREAVARFVEREMLALIAASPAWRGGALDVAKVAIASNRIRVAIGRGEPEADAPLVLSFEEQSGWLVAGVSHAGFTAALSEADRVIVENAIAGIYQLAGVDLVREQIAAALPGAPPYDIAGEGLVVWPGDAWATELVYPLDGRSDLTAKVRGAAPASPPPVLPRARVLFREQPIAWAEWVAAWSAEVPRRVVKGAPLLPARAAT